VLLSIPASNLARAAGPSYPSGTLSDGPAARSPRGDWPCILTPAGSDDERDPQPGISGVLTAGVNRARNSPNISLPEESMRLSRIASIGWMLMIGLLASCASGGASTGGAQTAVGAEADASGLSVVIRTPPGSATVTAYMVPEVGVDTPLGTVNPGLEAKFSVDPAPGRYRIRLVGGEREEVSDIFDVFGNSAMARWDVSISRRVVVSSRREF